VVVEVLLGVALVEELVVAAGLSAFAELSDDVPPVDSALLAAGFADE
jgi:hypothetical protein